MKDALSVNIKGIKCDNPDCDYKDMEVPFSDYTNWLNKPCPKCGKNLLTEQDYQMCKVMLNLADIVREELPQVGDDEPMYKMSLGLNGSGKVAFSGIEPIEKEGTDETI